MNIAALPIQMSQQSLSKVSNNVSNTPSKSVFGSVFGSVVGSMTETKDTSTQGSISNAQTGAVDILNSSTLEELLSTLSKDENLQNAMKELLQIDNPLQLNKLAELIQVDMKQVIQTIVKLLNGPQTPNEMKKDVDLQKALEELINESNSKDQLGENVWSLLSIIERTAPLFVKELTNSLNGKGNVSDSQSLDLVKLLKMIELMASKTDLHMKQETQLFSLKEILTTSLKTVENSLMQVNVKSFEVRPVIHAIEAKNVDTQEIQVINSDRVIMKSDTHTIVLPTNKGTQTENLIKEFQAVLNRSTFGQSGGATKLLIKLYPEHLGSIRIELLQRDGVMTARLLASTPQGKELLDGQLQQLKHAFVQQNINIDRIDISQALQDPTRNDKQQQSLSQQFRDQQNEKDEQSNEKDEEFATFQELLVELEV